MVADLDALVVGGGLRDDACAFVAEGERIHADRNVPGDVVVVGVAHAARDELDLDFVLAGILHLEVDHLEFAGDMTDDGTASFHTSPWGW